MKKEGALRNQLRAVRTRLGMSQQELAAAAGVVRQTIGGIEAGTYALSLTVSLHLAKALGCSVEELFWLEGDLPAVEAALTGGVSGKENGKPIRVALAKVEGRWVASPLVGETAFRQEMVPADGIGTWNTETNSLSVQLLDTADTLAQTVMLAGCTPALSLWARSAERWHPGLRVHWRYANSTEALEMLARGEVHIAGTHLFDLQTGDDNAVFVRKAIPSGSIVLVTLGSWEEGFLVASGNPKGLHSTADLTRSDVRLVNREPGAGSRLLLDALLARDGVSAAAVTGYDRSAPGHREVAREIQTGSADIGVSTAGIAETYGLTFLPLQTVRYDLAMRQESLKMPSVQQLLGTLHHRWVRSQLATLGGYDTTHTGDNTIVVPRST